MQKSLNGTCLWPRELASPQPGEGETPRHPPPLLARRGAVLRGLCPEDVPGPAPGLGPRRPGPAAAVLGAALGSAAAPGLDAAGSAPCPASQSQPGRQAAPPIPCPRAAATTEVRRGAPAGAGAARTPQLPPGPVGVNGPRGARAARLWCDTPVVLPPLPGGSSPPPGHTRTGLGSHARALLGGEGPRTLFGKAGPASRRTAPPQCKYNQLEPATPQGTGIKGTPQLHPWGHPRQGGQQDCTPVPQFPPHSPLLAKSKGSTPTPAAGWAGGPAWGRLPPPQSAAAPPAPLCNLKRIEYSCTSPAVQGRAGPPA